MSDKQRPSIESLLASPELTAALTDIPIPAEFTIDGTPYERFYSYLQNWGQALQSWGVGYNFLEVALPTIGDPAAPTTGNAELDAALIAVANALSVQNQQHPDDETQQWRMRAVGGKFSDWHDLWIGGERQKVGLMGTHCWVPILGDDNLHNPLFPEPWCLSTWFRILQRASDTSKECYIKLPESTAVGLLDLPASYPEELKAAGAKLATVTPGASMLAFSEGLAAEGYYLSVPTAPGVLSVGGVVAIGGHGSGVWSAGSDSMKIPQYAFSSVSNQVVWMDVLAYNTGNGQYELTRVSRDDASADRWSAMACGLGRSFAVRMAFLVYPMNQAGLSARILQINHFVNGGTLMGADGTAPGSLQYLAQNYGGFEPIQFPTYNDEFYDGQDFVWTKTWSYHPASTDFTAIDVFHKDADSGQTVASKLEAAWYSEVDEPFNYPSTAGISCSESVLIVDALRAIPELTPVTTNAAAILTGSDESTGGGFHGTPTDNGKTALWSETNLNVYYFVEPDTLRAFDWSYGVQCRFDQIQDVVNTFYTESLQLLQEFQGRKEFPLIAAGEIRLVGLDRSPDPAWSYPALSNPSPGLLPTGTDPAGMVCVYLSWLSSFYHPAYWPFCAGLEDRLFFGAGASLGAYTWAPEWSKAWACTDDGPYLSDTKLERIRENFNNGANSGAFSKVADDLASADPDKLFYSKMIGRIFGN